MPSLVEGYNRGRIESRFDLSRQVIHQFLVFGATLLAFLVRRMFPSLQLCLCVREIDAQIAKHLVTGGAFLDRLTAEGEAAFGGHYAFVHLTARLSLSRRSYSLTIVDGAAFGE
jgi:hypothetical protein